MLSVKEILSYQFEPRQPLGFQQVQKEIFSPLGGPSCLPLEFWFHLSH